MSRKDSMIVPALRAAPTAALILGSARRSGWSQKLGRSLSALAPAELALQAIEIADLPLYHEDLEQAVPAEWARFRAQIRAVDALLFVTPEYNRSVPAALKNAIDIGSSPDDHSVWSGKPAAVASFSPGRLGGFGATHHLRQTLVFLDVPVLQQPEIYLSEAEQLFDAEGQLREGPARDLLSEFLLKFLAWITLIQRPALARG
ncbi:MAG: NAD(P)H-dependent oxidoreductase [Polyangiaceae bacterium]